MLKSSQTGSEREVLFRLKAMPDKNNPRAFKQLADSAVKAQQEIDKSATRGANHAAKEAQRVQREAEKATRDKERSELQSLIRRERNAKKLAEQQVREEQRAAKESEKLAREKEREEERLHRRHRERQRSIAAQNRQARAEEKAERDRAYNEDLNEAIRVGNEKKEADERSAKEQAAAQRRTEQEHERAASRVKQRQQQSIEGTKQLIEGTLKLGRAFVLSGALGEKEMQKVVNTLLKVQVAADTVRGGIDAVQGLSKTGIGAGLGTALGMSAGAATAAVATVGTIVVGSLVVSRTQTGAAAAASGLQGLAAGLKNDYSEAGDRRPRGWMDEFLGEYGEANRTAARTRRIQLAAQERQKDRIRLEAEQGREDSFSAMNHRNLEFNSSAFEGMKFRNDLRGANRSRQTRIARDIDNLTAFQAAAGRANEERPGTVSDGRIAREQARLIRSYEQMRDLKKEEWDIRREANERDKAVQQSTVQSYRQQLDLIKQRRREIADQERQMRVSVAQANPMDRHRAATALDKLNRGEVLNAQEAEAARMFSTDRTRKQIDQAQLRGFEQNNPGDRLAAHVRRQFDEERRRNAERQRDANEAIRSANEQYTELERQFGNYTDAVIKSVDGITKNIEAAIRRLEKLTADADARNLPGAQQ